MDNQDFNSIDNYNNISSGKLQLIPETGISERMLTVAIAIMCYLACLSLGAMIIINNSVEVWVSDTSNRITIQIVPVSGADLETELVKAEKILEKTKGLKRYSVLDIDTSTKLLEPWLGNTKFLEELPVPRIISIEVDVNNPPDISKLSSRIQAEVSGAQLDNHKHWQSQLKDKANILKKIGYGIIILISIATVAIVVFSTRAAMNNNNGTISVLHLVGANDSFIALLIQKKFLKLGIIAGFTGFIAGIASFIIINLISVGLLSYDRVHITSELIYGNIHLGFKDYLAIAIIPFVIIFLSSVTAAISTISVLQEKL